MSTRYTPIIISTLAFLVVVTASLFSATSVKQFLLPHSQPTVLGEATECTEGDTDNWCQAGRTSNRSGYSPEPLVFTDPAVTKLEVLWKKGFQPEKIHPQIQPIIYRGKVFFGSEHGTAYALSTSTGDPVWTKNITNPVITSVAAHQGAVFFPTAQGEIFALNEATGDTLWHRQYSAKGFSAHLLIANDTLYAPNRDGNLYAINPTNGTTVWTYSAGSPLLMGAAYSNNRIFIGSMNKVAHAIDATTGAGLWQSPPLNGMILKDYWPVIHQGTVIFRTLEDYDHSPAVRPGAPFGWWSSQSQYDWLNQTYNGQTHRTLLAQGTIATLPDFMSIQDTAVANHNPNHITFHLLDETSGANQGIVPQFVTQTHNGVTTPPCIDRDGLLIVPVSFIRSSWARLDLSTQRIVDILFDDYSNTKQYPLPNFTTPAGMGNDDENMNVSCMQNAIFGFHMEEANANYTGYFNQDTRRWTQVGTAYGSTQMSTNTQGGSGSPPVIAGGKIYHNSLYNINARYAP